MAKRAGGPRVHRLASFSGCQALRMYVRTVSGAMTATITAAPSSDHTTWTPKWPSLTSSRTAVTTCDTGLTLTNACIQPGIVFAGTNALDMNVSGNRMSIEMPCTDDALLIRTPISAKIQLIEKAQTTTSAPADSTPTTPPP